MYAAAAPTPTSSYIAELRDGCIRQARPPDQRGWVVLVDPDLVMETLADLLWFDATASRV